MRLAGEKFSLIAIAAPPLAGIFANVQPGVVLEMSNLMANQIYQLLYATQLNDTWQSLVCGNFLTASRNQRQYLFATNNVGYYLLQYVP